jgi:capsid protein
MDVEGGTVSIIGSTSKATAFTHDRPSPNTREWRDTVKGDLAAGAGVSRVWTDRDGQRYNFANSKFDQIRSQMMARMQQDWFGDGVASWPYEQSLPWMMLRLGRSMPTSKNELRRLKRHRLVPDIPPELDELSAAKAFEAGSRNGIDSRADFLGRRGRDPEAIAKQIDAEARDDAARAAERIAVAQRLCEELNAKDPSLKLHWSHIVTLPGAKTAPGAYLQAAAPQAETSATGDQPPA